MTKPRLTHFEMRGRAEAIRLLLHSTRTEFSDVRVVSQDEWAALKPALPFGVLPIYQDSGGVLCESHGILRYLGRTLLCRVVDERDEARLDAAQDAIAELQEDLWHFNWHDRYCDHLESYARDNLLPRLSSLQAWIDMQPGEWIGNAFSQVAGLQIRTTCLL